MQKYNLNKIVYHNTAGCYLVRKINNSWEILLINRRWTNGDEGWVLPKGHIEKDESLEQAAIRETTEETGFKDIKIIRKLDELNIEYLEEGIKQRKTIHYFLAELISDKNIGINLTEGENPLWGSIKWYSLNDALKIMKFDDEKEILKKLINQTK